MKPHTCINPQFCSSEVQGPLAALGLLLGDSHAEIKVLAGLLPFLEALDMNPRPSPSCRFQNSGSPGCRTEVCVPAGDQLRACCAPAGPRPAPSASPAVPLPPQQWPVTSLSCFKHLQLSCLQARKVSILRTHKMRFCLPGSLYDAVTLIPSAETPLSPNTALSQVPEKPGVGILGGHDATGPVIMDQKRNKQRINNSPPPPAKRPLPGPSQPHCHPVPPGHHP